MAATSSPQATLAALDVLRAGGNAVDAAVTASAVLCICEPQMTGIGGDCFALIGDAEGNVRGLNASGRSSMRADADWLKSSGLRDITKDSIHAITVPGAVDGWDVLLREMGTITPGEALEPAIALAESGLPIGPRTAYDWAHNLDALARDDGGKLHYLIDGRTPKAGEIMVFPAMARTLSIVAKGGRDAFYTGEIAEDIVAHLAARGSLLTMEDFAATKATWVEPISTEFHGCEVCEIPPNGQGLTALIAMNILSQFDLAQHAPDSVERRHLEVEAVRLAWVMRDRHIADPAFADVPVDDLLSAETASKLAALIDMERAIIEPESSVPKSGSDTVYLTVVDKDRQSVSFINSVYSDFGSKVITPNTSIALQDRGAGFVATPGHPNCIEPGKRPLHTIIPAMRRENGKVTAPFGVMGGNYQPMGHVAVMVNTAIYGMDPQEALEFPRAFHDKGQLDIEDGVNDAVAQGLADKGHMVSRKQTPLGGGQMIAIDWAGGTLTGGSDPRKDGLALGY
jgi:gamma-glutamyltranspeptidase/glutathione hydrolase